MHNGANRTGPQLFRGSNKITHAKHNKNHTNFYKFFYPLFLISWILDFFFFKYKINTTCQERKEETLGLWQQTLKSQVSATQLRGLTSPGLHSPAGSVTPSWPQKG